MKTKKNQKKSSVEEAAEIITVAEPPATPDAVDSGDGDMPRDDASLEADDAAHYSATQEAEAPGEAIESDEQPEPPSEDEESDFPPDTEDVETEAPGGAEAGIEEIESGAEPEPEAEDDEADIPPDVEEIGAVALTLASPEEAKRVIEALLFVSTEPMTDRRLSNAMAGALKPAEVRALALELAGEYKEQQRGMILVEMAGGWQFSSRPEFAPWILRLMRHKKRSPLSAAALETLAIIAYKQPITRAEVDAIRGVESSGVVRTLLDMELIEAQGRKETLGKPQLYGTSEKFLRAFGLRKLDELPSIHDLRIRYEIGGEE